MLLEEKNKQDALEVFHDKSGSFTNNYTEDIDFDAIDDSDW